MTEHLIRRDLPLAHGRKLVFTFSVAYEVTVDNDLTGDDEPVSLDDLEHSLAGSGEFRSSEQIYKTVAENYDRTVVEHEVTLDDRYEGEDDGPVRFESTWEQRDRLAGRAGLWRTRQWLDGIPDADAGPGPDALSRTGAPHA